MRVVPANRLLIQPTVQLKWFQQHGELEFVLEDALQLRFLQAWTEFQASHNSLISFLNDPANLHYRFYEDDHLFALITGADFIASHAGPLDIRIHQPNLTWLPQTRDSSS